MSIKQTGGSQAQSAGKKKPTMVAPRVDEASPTLMGNQDTKDKGDARGVKTKKVPFSLVVPEDLLEDARSLAAEEGTSVARLMVEGLRWRIKNSPL